MLEESACRKIYINLCKLLSLRIFKANGVEIGADGIQTPCPKCQPQRISDGSYPAVLTEDQLGWSCLVDQSNQFLWTQDLLKIPQWMDLRLKQSTNSCFPEEITEKFSTRYLCRFKVIDSCCYGALNLTLEFNLIASPTLLWRYFYQHFYLENLIMMHVAIRRCQRLISCCQKVKKTWLLFHCYSISN